MTTERDRSTRIVLSWLREDAHENAERVLLRALDEVDATQQRRSWWPAWRSDRMNTYAKLIAAAAAVLVVAVVGYQFLPGRSGPGVPTTAPSPTPTLLARGSFNVAGRRVELDAAGAGSSVTGSMSTADDTQIPPESFTVDLQCTRATEDGLILIGGDVTDSTTGFAPAGTWAGIVLQPGSPVQAQLVYQLDDPRMASCLAFLEQMISFGEPDLELIDGTIELRP
jgi:hypothetical protein